MSTDDILRKVLANPALREKYWPEITNPEAQNLNTLLQSVNINLQYLHIIFSDSNDNTRRNALANLIN